MAVLYPVIGQWFSRPNGTLFEVVAVDEDDGTVELQQFDGTIDEIDLYDMAGNIGEWCWDWFDLDYYLTSPGTDPRGVATANGRARPTGLPAR